MTWVAAAIGGSAVLSAGVSLLNKPKTPTYQPLDINKVITDARTNAATTLQQSKALEAQYMPGTAALRNTADVGLGQLGQQSTAGFQARNALLGGMGSPIADSSVSSNPLLQSSADRIMGQLNLGGKLDAETQSAAMRGALQGAGTAGIAGSGAGRGLAARDLGLTSLALQNQRTQAAQGAGSTMAQLGLAGQQLKLQDYLQRYNAAQGATGQDIQSAGLLAGIIDARQMPNAGLSSTDIANLYSGQNNAQNQANFNAAAIKQQQSNADIQALLGLTGTAASLYAGGGFGSTPLVKPDVGFSPTAVAAQAASGGSKINTKLYG